MKKFLFFVLAVMFFMGCKSDKAANYPSVDLLKHGFSIKVNAPADAKIEFDDFGIMQEVTIDKGDEYNIQILKSRANTNDVKKVISEQLQIVKSERYFSKIVEEYDNGFIFEKKIDDRINFDFRCVKLQGDDEYMFQTGFAGKFTEENVRSMYKSVQ